MIDSIPVVDVFAGCGGLGEGFSAWQQSGSFPFDVRLHIEKEPAPIRTLQLRAFYHQFREGAAPDGYYKYVRGEIDREQLFKDHPAEAEEALRRCLQVELGSSGHYSERQITDSIERAIGETDSWVLIGGPPCQAYSTIGRVRNKATDGYDPDADVRLELYREYLKIISALWPAVFVMENVRGLLSASRRSQKIFDKMLADLREPASAAPSPDERSGEHTYKLHSVTTRAPHLSGMDATRSPTEFVVKAEQYGVPQARHRVVVVGVRDDILLEPAPLGPKPARATVGAVLDGMPRVRSGLSQGDSSDAWVSAVNQIEEEEWWGDVAPLFRERMTAALQRIETPTADRGHHRFLSTPSTSGYRPDWFEDERLKGTLNHMARGHRKDDLWRYLYAACVMDDPTRERPFRLDDFPTGLLPQHKNAADSVTNGHFTDRFSVQRKDAPSRTVVSHIRKDGHYYIHYDPSQCRSLTVREAARLQTFPDNYFFEGNRTEQYGQIGNAVPPLLSYQIAESVWQTCWTDGVSNVMDSLSPEHRSWNMSRIRGGNTKPERMVRSLLHHLGLPIPAAQEGPAGSPRHSSAGPADSHLCAWMLLAPTSRGVSWPTHPRATGHSGKPSSMRTSSGTNASTFSSGISRGIPSLSGSARLREEPALAERLRNEIPSRP